MRSLEVLGVRLEESIGVPVLLLKDVDSSRCLPLWIGANEASAIANALEGVLPPRPLTHDLMVTILETLDHDLIEGVITDMVDSTFRAELHIDDEVISARPSDVVAIAVRTGMPLSCPEELLERVGVDLQTPQDEVERFKEFLDSVNPDDFESS